MDKLAQFAEKIIHSASEKGLIISVAESCTGGLVSAALTEVAGSSEAFDRGFITYSYEAKAETLGVSNYTLTNYGAVSRECVEEMALGALKNSHAHISVSISGIAGPSGGTPEKPVGLVYFAYFDKIKNKLKSEKQQYQGSREEVRQKSSMRALELLSIMINEHE
jgi:nicotinamide-nucleotide amidase